MILCWSWFFKGLVDDKGSLYLQCWYMPLQLPCVVLDGERSRMNEYVDFPKSILAAMLWKDVLQIKEQVENSQDCRIIPLKLLWR